MNTQIDTVS